MKRVYLVLIMIVLAIAIGGYIGVKMYNKVPTSTNDLKADATIDVAKITSDFKADSSKASKKYGKMTVIILKGKVDKIVSASGLFHINFSANNVNIDCLVDKNDTTGVSMIKNGGDAQIKGKYSGYILDEIVDPQPQLQLKDCIIQK